MESIVQFGPWRPDLPPLGNDGLLTATGVVPDVGSYEPYPQPVTVTESISGTCIGAFACLDSAGQARWFAGEADKLWHLNSTSVSISVWTDVSGGGGYATTSEEFWSFAQFGDLVFAANFNDDLQVFSMTSAAVFSTVGGQAPRARYLGVVKGFLVAVNVFDADGARPQRVRWSGLEQPTSFTVAAVTQSDFQDLLGPGGWNQGIVAGLITDLVGPPLVFSFDPVEGVRGSPAPRSIVQSGGFAFYYGEDGFYQFDGVTSTPIGNSKVDDFFAADVDAGKYDRITAVADVQRKLVFWHYVSGVSPTGQPDHILAYNWETAEWSLLVADGERIWRTRRLTAPVGNTEVGLFSVAHRAQTFTGGAMAATLVTGERQPSPQHRTFITQAWPLLEGGTPIVAIGRRDTQDATVSFETGTQINALGFCPQRVDARYVRYELSLSASASWSRVQGLRIIGVERGTR